MIKNEKKRCLIQERYKKMSVDFRKLIYIHNVCERVRERVNVYVYTYKCFKK